MKDQQLDGIEKLGVKFLACLSFLCFQTALRNQPFTQDTPMHLAFCSADGSLGLTPPACSQTPGIAGSQEYQHTLVIDGAMEQGGRVSWEMDS